MRGNTDEGQREILGLEVAFGETQAAWERLLGRPKKRGLEGVEVATSDAHDGLRQAVEENFPGVIWQRCHPEESLGVHFRRNVLDQTPAKLKDEMHDRLDDILEASSPAKARAAFGRAETALEGTADAALAVLSGGWEQATAVLALPAKYRRRLRTSNMIERFIEEIRRREKVVRIFPNRKSAWRLIGALCAEKHKDGNLGFPRSTGRRYLTMDEFYQWKASCEEVPSDQPQPVAA
jgi:transposase-like protein